ncbi:MAG: hypothetical protein ACTSRI_11345 [Promethearchaeota archaeon]
MHYAMVSLDEGDEDDDFINLIGGKTEGGIAKEIRADGATGSQIHPLGEKDSFGAPSPAKGMNIAGTKKSLAGNTGPLYTGQESMGALMQDEIQVNFNEIMAKLEEIKIPLGFERELIIIGNHAYAVVEKVQTFLGKKQVEKVMERVGTIPDGIFFAESYSPRILSENGKVIAIEFLKRIGDGESATKPTDFKSKKEILKEQIKMQLSGK